MKEHIEKRRAELQQEHERGTKMLTQMDQERAELEQALLRISGAIQALSELLNLPEGEGNDGDNQ